MAAIITFLASFVYLLGFFVQSLINPPVAEDEDEHLLAKDDSRAKPCAQLELDDLKIKKMKIETDDLKIKTKIVSIVEEADEEIVKSVVEGKIPSYALESKLGDCRRAAAIRRKALQRTTEKSLEGLPLEGFDYESILGSVVRCRWATSRFRWASQGCCCSTGDTKNPLAVVDADYSYRVREQTIWLNDLT